MQNASMKMKHKRIMVELYLIIVFLSIQEAIRLLKWSCLFEIGYVGSFFPFFALNDCYLFE